MRAQPVVGILIVLSLAGCADPSRPAGDASAMNFWPDQDGCEWPSYVNDDWPERDPCLPDAPHGAFAVSPGPIGPLGRCNLQYPLPEMLEREHPIKWQWWFRPGQDDGGSIPGWQNGLYYNVQNETGPLYGVYSRIYPLDADDIPELFWWEDTDSEGFVWFPETFQNPDVQWQVMLVNPTLKSNGSKIDEPMWRTSASFVTSGNGHPRPGLQGWVPILEVSQGEKRLTWPFYGTQGPEMDRRALDGVAHWGQGLGETPQVQASPAYPALENITLDYSWHLHGHDKALGQRPSCCPIRILDDPLYSLSCQLFGPDGGPVARTAEQVTPIQKGQPYRNIMQAN